MNTFSYFKGLLDSLVLEKIFKDILKNYRVREGNFLYVQLVVEVCGGIVKYHRKA